MTSTLTVHRLVHAFVVPAATMLLAATGCVIISPSVPKVVTVKRDCGQPLAADLPPAHSKPYAAALDRVLRQEACVERELRERDWDDLGDELGDWQKYVRRLAGVADTSSDPVLMRRCCETLEEQIEMMRRARRNRDKVTIEALLDEAALVLNRLSNEFPLTEPATTKPARADA